jgi:hypothetical protein
MVANLHLTDATLSSAANATTENCIEAEPQVGSMWGSGPRRGVCGASAGRLAAKSAARALPALKRNVSQRSDVVR